MMKVCFDILHLYYLPQYLPVLDELIRRGDLVYLMCYEEMPITNKIAIKDTVKHLKVDIIWSKSKADVLAEYQKSDFSWIIFGHGFKGAEQLSKTHKTVLMQHGIGPKKCYYEVSDSGMSVRFVEGQHRLDKLAKQYPNATFVDTGFAKLDPILSGTLPVFDLLSIGLDPAKKTILYAPTFYPSSIERMPSNLPELLREFNVIIKPHQFSLEKKAYKKQREALKRFAQFDNVYLTKSDEYSLLPFMSVADIMLSDASSAVFEFLALGKPVVWCNFFKLRWSYRGPLSFRFKKRLDEDIAYFERLCIETKQPGQLIHAIEQAQIENPATHQSSMNEIVRLAGTLDGQASIRIVNYLKEAQ